MPATSERQRKFMGLALAVKRGKAKRAGGAAKRAAAEMTETQLEEFASKPIAKSTPRKRDVSAEPRKPKGAAGGGQWTKGKLVAPSAADQEQAIENIKSLLHAIIRMKEGMNAGKCIERHILDHGRPFTVTPGSQNGRPGPKKQCYMNSGQKILRQSLVKDDDLTYCEGYVAVHGFPIEHAWLTDKDGNVIETTIRGDHALGYFGVPYQSKYLFSSLSRRKFYGLHYMNEELVEQKKGHAPEQFLRKLGGDE